MNFLPSEVFAFGGIAGIVILIVLVYALLKSFKYLIMWAALGGPSVFQIFGTALLDWHSGRGISEIIVGLPVQLMVFLRPLDQMLISDVAEWMKVVIGAVLWIWLMLCVGFAKTTIAEEWLKVSGLWGVPLGFIIWYGLTGTLVAGRGLIAENLPLLTPLVTPYYGVGLILLVTAITVLIAFLQSKRARTEY